MLSLIALGPITNNFDIANDLLQIPVSFISINLKDIDRYVYGVKRYISTSDVSDSQVDIAHYEGWGSIDLYGLLYSEGLL